VASLCARLSTVSSFGLVVRFRVCYWVVSLLLHSLFRLVVRGEGGGSTGRLRRVCAV